MNICEANQWENRGLPSEIACDVESAMYIDKSKHVYLMCIGILNKPACKIIKYFVYA